MRGLIGAACALPPAIAFGVALSLTSPVPAESAATQPAETPGQPDTSLVTGGHYTADAEHTLVEWTVDHLGFTPYYGLFGDISGEMDIDPARPEQARVEMTIPVSEVTVASEGLADHLLRPAEDGGSPDFFGPEPEDARFVSTMVKPSGDGEAQMTGNLTLNGVTAPVTLNVRFHGAGTMPEAMGGDEVIGFEATGFLKRSEFDLGFSIPMVSDEVQLKIAAAFIKET